MSKELIVSLTALDMAILTKVACFRSLRGKIDFENMSILEKRLKNLPLEQNIFSVIYFQLCWGVCNN